MLIGQHVALSKANTDPTTVPDDYVGIICTKTNLLQVAEDAGKKQILMYDIHICLLSS